MSKKTILITGASSGIGKATAEMLASKKYHLVLASRHVDKLQALADRHPDQILLHKTDVTDKKAVHELFEAALDRFGNVDVLVNNAGVGFFNPLEQASLEEWDTMIDTNIKGLLYCIHEALNHMVKNNAGHIINVGSVASHQVFPNNVVYCATKHAVKAITDGMRLELSDKIKCTMVSPGAVNTGFLGKTNNEAIKQDYKEYFETALKPEHIAHHIVYCIEQPEEVVISEVIVRPNR